MKRKKIIKTIKKNIYSCIFLILCLVLLVALYFTLNNSANLGTNSPIYISSYNPKQGDTVLIKIGGDYPEVSGYFDKQKLLFFKPEESSNRFSLLGIDADLTPGKHEIFLQLSPAEKIVKEINVSASDFKSANVSGNKTIKDKGYTKSTIINNVLKVDNPVLAKAMERSSPQPYFKKPFTYPLSQMKKSGLGFGMFVGAISYLQHFGIDLQASKDTTVYAINDGKVVLTQDLSNYGKTIIIDHGLGIFSLYLHLDQYKVSEGQTVKEDQAIGLSGDSGLASGPHLHFSIKLAGNRVDPVEFIAATQSI